MKKKNKLYTANKWNQPLFAKGMDRENNNILDGMFQSTLNTSLSGNNGFSLSNPYQGYSVPQLTKPNVQIPTDWSNGVQRSQAIGNTNAMVNSFGNEAAANNIFSKIGGGSGSSAMGWAGAAKAAATAVLNTSAGDKALDTFDPVFHLAGGRESTVGNSLSTAGKETFKQGVASGSPYAMLAGAGLKVIGGLTNAAFGIKTDKQALNAANNGINYYGNFRSDATDFDDVTGVQNTYSFNNPYTGGWFSKGKARRKNEKLKKEFTQAESWANRSVDNNINNIADTQMDNLMANYAAFGGPLGNSGAIDYGFMTDYLTTKNKAIGVKDKMNNNIFGSLANPTMFALGGDMQTNGSDFTDGLSVIGAGGSHESNPYQGVQVGISRANGEPNLVEENETIFDDYVFSKRIKADAKTKKKFHVGKNTDISYADLSKKLEKESAERPNDPISQNGLTKQLHELAEEQERQKSEQQTKQAQDMFNSLPPEQQAEIMQQMAQQEQQAQQQEAMQEPPMQNPQQQPMVEGQPEEQMQQPQMEEQPMEGQQMNACGGKINRYDAGGDMKTRVYKALNPYVQGGIHTDDDFNQWLYNQKLDPITDWDNILKNKSFIDALSGVNPSLGDAISRGYDFGAYTAPTSKYDLAKFNKTLDNYTKSKVKGNTEGNYAIDDAFNLGKYKTIADYEAAPEYKAYTDYLVDAIKRNKGIAFRYGDNDHTYDNIVWKDPNKKISREDFDILNTLQHHIDGTSVNPNGDVVPLWNKADGDGYSSLASNADTLVNSYRNDGKGGIFHLTPTALDRGNEIVNYEQKVDGTVVPIIGDVPKDWKNVGSYDWQDDKANHGVRYYTRPGDATAANAEDAKKKKETPIHKPTWGRYVGLFGPAVGLGLQAAGVGKPDYSRLDASVEAASGAPALAHYKPIGDYLSYNPMDIWYEQNRMNANSRATDRAILNNSSPLGTKTAGLLANGYNSQIASGNLYRQALEYNDAQRQKVADFNRGTNMFNAEAFNRTSQTNAELQNRNRQFKAQMAMDAARQRMAADAAWNQGIYGNVQGFFKGLSDWGRENEQHNMIAKMAADGLFGVGSGDNQYTFEGYTRKEKGKKSRGGKLNRRRGLTF